MKNKSVIIFRSPMVRKAAACCIALLLIAALIAGGREVTKQIVYEREIGNELYDITEKTGWYIEQFYVEHTSSFRSSDPRKDYTFQDYKADMVSFGVVMNVTPSIDDPQLGEDLYQYLTELYSAGYRHICFSIKDDFAGCFLLFHSDDARPYLTDFRDKKGFLKRVDRALKSCRCDCESCGGKREAE